MPLTRNKSSLRANGCCSCSPACSAFAAHSAGKVATEGPSESPVCGHSITFWNDMPSWIVQLSKSPQFQQGLETADASEAGARLSGHLISTAYGNALDTIRKRSWDIVVLQGYSTEPLDEPGQFFPAALKFVEEIRSTAAEPVLFQTYAYAQSHAACKKELRLGGTPSEMQRRVSEAYAKVAHQTGVRVARVGEAFQWATANNL